MEVRWSKLFAPLHDAVDIPERAGVYLLWTQVRDGGWMCFFAGESDNLHDAVATHLDPLQGHFEVHQVLSEHTCGFMYAHEADPARRDGILRHLVEVYAPKYGSLPEGDGDLVVVNLPTD